MADPDFMSTGQRDAPTTAIERSTAIYAGIKAGPLMPGGGAILMDGAGIAFSPNVISVTAVYAVAHIHAMDTETAQIEAETRVLVARLTLKEAQDRLANSSISKD